MLAHRRIHQLLDSIIQLPDPPRADLVTSNHELTRLCRRWLEAGQIAVDTEFIRTRTFYPRLGLIQVADPESLYLLDAVALDDWSPFIEVLREPRVLKVLHSPSEDLELFDYLFGELPTPMFDTQTACTLAGLASMPGLQRMVSGLFGVDLPKGQQRSNWLVRPLSASQLLYAGLDVAYLLPAWEMLWTRIRELDRDSWFAEEMERLVEQCRAKNEPETIYGRLFRPNLDALQAGVLFELVSWRERQARQRNLPRRFVLGDDSLLEIARRRPLSLEDLAQLELVPEAIVTRHGAELLSAVSNATPRRLADDLRDLSKVGKGKLSALREALDRQASELELPAEFLASRKTIEKVARRVDEALDPKTPEVPSELLGWRWRTLGDELVSALVED